GMAKNTYGTGCFLLMHTGAQAVCSRHGLLTTIAWQIGDQLEYALEGSIFVAGSAVQWLRDGLRLIDTAADSGALAQSVASTGGVYCVPAFVGLGAPYWRSDVRGALFGLTRGSGRAEICRAVLEAIAFQTRDVLDAMQADAGLALERLRVDGGAVANAFLMQFQSDILGVPVERPAQPEATAFGAAALAGLATGFWADRAAIAACCRPDRRFEPALPAAGREASYAGWRQAVQATLGFRIDPA
ncbi:MAG TPA: FGGY-family carbohydrate kinase, partial [Plasticicumulans sp.]|nr:FGGY-family carbohydrate kinase [Plasticicumulans sp.]